MGKKHNFEFVKETIESLRYKLISAEYINCDTKLEIECSQGHRWWATFTSILNAKTGCPYCAGLVKHSFEKVKEDIESLGHQLLSTEYINANAKLRVKGVCGHEWETSYNSLVKLKTGCPYCCRNPKINHDIVKQRIEELGHKLLSTEYKNAKTKLEIKYACGHIGWTNYDTLNSRKRGCAICSGNIEHSFEKVKADIESLGIILESAEYINSNSKLKLKCQQGHTWEACYNSVVKQKTGCPYCAGVVQHSFNEAKERIESLGFFLDSTEYVSVHSPLKIRCKFEHTWISCYNEIVNAKSGCPVCAGTMRHTFEKVKEIIESLGIILESTKYLNAKSKLKLRCQQGHTWEACYSSVVLQKTGCPHCWKLNNRGINHHSWQGGGILDEFLRGATYEWKISVLQDQNYTCQISNVKSNIVVHHASVNFKALVNKALKFTNLLYKHKSNDYEYEELEQLRYLIIQYHKDVIGECMEKTVHDLFHVLYGKHNTYEQYLEFKQRYENGEFKDRLL